MMPTDSMYARHANTRGSRVNDPGLERYLRIEYLGGGTLAELQADKQRSESRVRRAVVRFVRTVLLDRNRLKPAPAPAGP